MTLTHIQEIEMTPIQQAYWVGRNSGLDLDGVSTHTCEEIDCSNLDLDRLERSFNKLIQRHDMMRARINARGKIEILAEVPHYDFAVDDLRGQTAIEAHKRIDHLRNRMYQEVLASDSWPLYRIKAIRLDGDRIRLFFSSDALILDASSRSVVFNEWRMLYENEDAVLPEIEGSFAEFIHEVTTDPTRLEKQDRAKSYWSDRIPEIPGPPRLEARKGVPSNDVFGRIEEDLPSELYQKIVSRCEALPGKVSVTSFFLTVFSRMLARWSKSPEFNVVLTLFDQTAQQDKYRSTVGDFTNTLLVDCSNDPNEPIENAAARIQAELRDSIKHSSHDGVEVRREINQRQAELKKPWLPDGVSTVFTSVLGSRHKDEWRSAWIGNLVNMQTQTPQVGLDSQLWKVKDTVRVTWDYARSIIDTDILQDMFRDFMKELESCADSSTADSRENTKSTGAPSVRSEGVMTDGIAWHVMRRPEATAIQCGSQTTTFEQLGERSMGVAEALRKLDPEGAAPVILAVERSESQVTGAVGIMLSGRPYVPVNTAWPEDRIRRIAGLCEATCIVCHDHFELPDGLDRLHRIDPAQVPEAPFDHEKWPNEPDDLAYIIFTSGSTGEPKGVAMQHGATMTTIDEIKSRYMIDADDCVFGISAMSFDLSVWDIFGGLGAGARLIIPEESEALDPGAWTRLVQQHGVTVWNSVPTLAQLMIERYEDVGDDTPLPVRLYLLSGDWIPPTLPRRLTTRGLRSKVVSLGGATEAAIWSVGYEIGQVPSEWRSIPYGRALKNQTIDVRSESLEKLGTGEIGEIVIGGAGLAREYFKDPVLTNLKFTDDANGDRVYRTGDLGRQLPDGNIEFLGRSDDQVKIAGHRIELGEVEFALNRHPDVEACMAKAVGPPCGERRLFAYIVPTAGRHDSIDLDAVRKEAGRTAPEYMVPATLKLISELPLSANGKVDRNADLDAMSTEWGEDHTSTSGAAPQAKSPPPSARSESVSSLQTEAVMQIAREILSLEDLTEDDNLLEHGASSVDMIRIANRIEQINGGIRPRLDDIYDDPTPKGITALLTVQVPPPSRDVRW